MGKITCLLLHNFIVLCCFNLTHFLFHNYIMCVYLNLKAMQVKEDNQKSRTLVTLASNLKQFVNIDETKQNFQALL